MINQLASWLNYIRLRRQDGRRVASNEILASAGLGVAFTLFWITVGLPQSFSKDGLIDGLGSITSVLAGFYVAGLVAIATFFRDNSSLDDIIQSGPAILNLGSEDEERLTRRQYVCSIFGLLVVLSFALSISAVVMRTSARPFAHYLHNKILSMGEISIEADGVVESFVVWLWISLFIWEIILTLRGLYYLMDRIYAVRPVLKNPRNPQIRDFD